MQINTKQFLRTPTGGSTSMTHIILWNCFHCAMILELLKLLQPGKLLRLLNMQMLTFLCVGVACFDPSLYLQVYLSLVWKHQLLQL